MSLAGRPSARAKAERLRAVLGEHTQPGRVYYLRVEHDDGCPAIDTQRLPDCTCDPIMRPPKHCPTSDELLSHMRGET